MVSGNIILKLDFSFQVEFLEKNNDALHDSLEQLVLESSDSFLKSLFLAPKTQANSKPGGKVKKLAFDSVGKKFRVRNKFFAILYPVCYSL